MIFLKRGCALTMGVLALGFASFPLADRAAAQENLDQGKSGAQLFASDCAICHKTSAGLSRGHVLGLDNFLREHYSASRESAAAIAAYVQATDKGPAAPLSARAAKKGTGKGTGKGDDKTKGPEKKLVLPGEAKPAEAKPAEVKPAEVKPAEVKPAEVKPAEVKPAEPNPSESKPNENKPSDGQPADIYKPEKKSD
jgi:hypothetical protein